MRTQLITIFAFFYSVAAMATHMRSGEILYKRVAPFGTPNTPIYTYSITVIKYTDDGPTIADRCVDTVYFGDGQKGIAPRINGSNTLGCSCSATLQCGQLILQQSGYTVKRNIYSTLHTYAGTGSYLISSTDPNRNPGIHNIPNSSSVPFYIESLLVINPLTGTNSSPVFGSDPINQATLGLCFYDNLNASDADGDSLSYELIPCAAPGYFYPEIGGGSISMNQSGTLTWCVPQLVAEYQVAYKVSEWRKNGSGVYVLIGYVIRDRQILVKPGTVGIAEQSESNLLFVYPNPVFSDLSVKLGSANANDYQFSVIDVNGKEVEIPIFNNGKNEVVLNLSTLSNGHYVLLMKAENFIQSKKFIKE